ncbi:MAG TPA: hypothetical protein VGC55_08945 [Dokdonella sp.]
MSHRFDPADKYADLEQFADIRGFVSAMTPNSEPTVKRAPTILSTTAD